MHFTTIQVNGCLLLPSQSQLPLFEPFSKRHLYLFPLSLPLSRPIFVWCFFTLNELCFGIGRTHFIGVFLSVSLPLTLSFLDVNFFFNFVLMGWRQKVAACIRFMKTKRKGKGRTKEERVATMLGYGPQMAVFHIEPVLRMGHEHGYHLEIMI